MSISIVVVALIITAIAYSIILVTVDYIGELWTTKEKATSEISLCTTGLTTAAWSHNRRQTKSCLNISIVVVALIIIAIAYSIILVTVDYIGELWTT